MAFVEGRETSKELHQGQVFAREDNTDYESGPQDVDIKKIERVYR